ncbi:retropepsin-like aspartic peptidase RloA3 [Halomonas sp. V046]|uniref:retropepsin-like aspartic peptidase RloA3 n=1 Tax=Halomonas sp. V046 TaxID=3459611 RepID=UPI004043DC5F
MMHFSSRLPLPRRLALLGLAVAPLMASPALQADDDAAAKDVFGWVEKATLEPWDVEVKAKLDSGALTSSLDARDIERFERDDEPWVRFALELENEDNGETFRKELERPLYRDMTVRGAGGRDERLVVLLKICMGDTIHEEQFSLRNREEMNYPLLLGRRTIGELGLLDVNETFLIEPSCNEQSPVIKHEGEGEYGTNQSDRQEDPDDSGESDDT